TAGDDSVCELCGSLEGVIFTVEEARGLLPRHPNCRCAWIPADVGETDKGQKRGEEKKKAIEKSVQAEAPKKELEQVVEETAWPGADLVGTPAPVVDAAPIPASTTERNPLDLDQEVRSILAEFRIEGKQAEDALA